MPLQPVPFGGLAALEADELVGIDRSIDASDCVLDDGTIAGRSGYRAATASALGAGGDTPQALARFRVGPSTSDARTVAVLGGKVNVVTDPSSEVLSDGVATNIGAPFATSAKISLAQLGRYMYVGTDESGVAWRRVKPDFTLEALISIPQFAKPTVAKGSLSYVVYRTAGLASTPSGGLSLQTSGMPVDWYRAMDAAGTGDPAVGENVEFNLGADADWSNATWVLFIVTPRTTGSGGGVIEISISDSAGTRVQSLGTITDVPPEGGSPNAVWCNISSVDPALKSAVRKVKFTVSASGGRFGIYGHCVVPSAPSPNPADYYVTGFDSGTGQEGPLSEVTQVSLVDGEVVMPGYSTVYLDGTTFRQPGGTSDPLSPTNRRIYNQEAGKDMPRKADIGVGITFSGNVPATSPSVKVRLYKVTGTGRRMVAETAAALAAAAAYSLVDPQGLKANTGQAWRASGTPPRCSALAASRKSRLVAGYENRVFISDYQPVNQTSDPWPSFSPIPVLEADGWSFNIAPNNAEQIQAVVAGDADYILTNHNCFVMTDLVPGSLPQHVFNRGALGRQAAMYAEDRLFWAAYDGLYTAENRTRVQEMTSEVRRLYTTWLAPDSQVVVGYKSRKLYVVQGTKFLRFDFVTGNWTRGTWAGTVRMMARWVDP